MRKRLGVAILLLGLSPVLFTGCAKDAVTGFAGPVLESAVVVVKEGVKLGLSVGKKLVGFVARPVVGVTSSIVKKTAKPVVDATTGATKKGAFKVVGVIKKAADVTIVPVLKAGKKAAGTFGPPVVKVGLQIIKAAAPCMSVMVKESYKGLRRLFRGKKKGQKDNGCLLDAVVIETVDTLTDIVAS